jgi:oxygen-independent coproporphyrinogen-3 oxidase
VSALLCDLDRELTYWDEPGIATIFIGGGTPSLFSGAAIAALLAGIAARCRLDPDVEVTLEANPGTAEAARFRDYIAAGVNRLSLGIQSFQDTKLAALGRIHGSSEGRRAIEYARAAGCDNLNLDLMFGLPGDAPGDSLAESGTGAVAVPEHISWYQLTIEEGTAFARQRPPCRITIGSATTTTPGSSG